MKKEKSELRFKTITDLHGACGLPNPQHPLIGLTHVQKDSCYDPRKFPAYDVLSFYKITFVIDNKGRVRYGQHYYDFDEGSMMFLAPNQLIGSTEYSGSAEWYVLLVHPDYLLGTPLAKKIKQYAYFSYAVNEALHLSDKERETILSVFQIIKQELDNRIDEFSQDVVIAQLDLLFNYANRYYKRQFLTRKVPHTDLLQQTEAILDEYFSQQKGIQHGLPSVQYVSDQLNISAGYLSDLLRVLIGQNATQYIHYKLIESAKETLHHKSYHQ